MTTVTSENTPAIQIPKGASLSTVFASVGNRPLEVGQTLKDGTVVLTVDLDTNTSLRMPAEIFGGNAAFGNQNNVVESANTDALHGHNDWRRITTPEGKTLANNWSKVTSMEPIPFWLDSTYSGVGALHQAGEEIRFGEARHAAHPFSAHQTPLVRSGLARELDV